MSSSSYSSSDPELESSTVIESSSTVQESSTVVESSTSSAPVKSSTSSDVVVESSSSASPEPSEEVSVDVSISLSGSDAPTVKAAGSSKGKKTKKELKEEKKASLEAEIEMVEHRLSLAELADHMGTDLVRGLSQDERASRLEEYGPNMLSPPKQTPEIIKFIKELTGFFSLLLWAGAILSFVGYIIDPQKDQSNLYIGIVLTVVVLFTGIFSYFQNKKSSDVMAKFKDFLPENALVYVKESKQPVKIDVQELVIGDVVRIETGSKIPADIRIIESFGLKVDNSSLTGEPLPQVRTVDMTDDRPLETKNIAFYATLATEGSAKGVVIGTGDNTVIGRIAGLAESTDSVETPIHQEIDRFITLISIVAITLGVLFFIIGLILSGGDIIANVVFMIGIIVANVPEGLLATVTVSLTLTAQRMARKQVLVKNLESVETLGSTSVICSDKTGTLTQNKMTVSHLWYDGSIWDCAIPKQKANFSKDDTTFKELLRIATLCNNCSFDPADMEDDKPVQEWGFLGGNASEAALVKFAQPIRDIQDMREKNSRVFEIPFDSANKFQVSVNLQEKKAKDKRLVMYMKGAPERVLARCAYIMLDGEEVPLTDKHRRRFQRAYDDLGGMGERVLGFCSIRMDKEYNADYPYDGTPDKKGNYNFPMVDLTFVGLMSLIDPPRPAVPDAVRNCQSAGIKVIMVTGDHPITAKAIAQKVGIITGYTVEDIAKKQKIPVQSVDPHDARAIVLHGQDLSEYKTDEAWDEILDHPEVVFARTSPQQKLVIVGHNQRRGEIVAVTGDGVNDSPALKKADIGVAMGIEGSDVSKEAADMILLDDNFASIVRGVEEGRLIFDNLKKSISYTLTSNIPEIAPFLFYITLQIPLPLSTVLILCVDLGTDLLPAISLAYEKAESDIMNRPPRDAKRDHLVTAKLIGFAYLQIGILQAMAGFYSYLVVLGSYGIRPEILFSTGFDWGKEEFLIAGVGQSLRFEALNYAQTSYFVSIVIVQWADLLISKTRKLSIFQQGLKNKILVLGLFEETILALLLVYIPPVNWVLLTRPLEVYHFFLPALPFSAMIFCYDEVRKSIIRKNPGGYIEKFTYW
eukprot:TRINITY_DN1145_c0_g1_i2.p1 TRINITY_DN1145_c0_g1~~TRINITY_DN1145_c0_g1_i2.p1  ORF type:complete len:1090 (+),score=302.41 TRINITY_DN1145_c0_g1_i2:16-3285(+)